MCELHTVLWFDGEQLGENNPNLRQRETGMGVQKVYHKKDYGIFLHSDNINPPYAFARAVKGAGHLYAARV